MESLFEILKTELILGRDLRHEETSKQGYLSKFKCFADGNTIIRLRATKVRSTSKGRLPITKLSRGHYEE